ncbi:glycosyltransferase family 4 protein [Candidatus Pacearchaeota archaeon]|nr:glycosyltransferase family 4 protein [Candidatus Pacearchaeota archaeon]
MKKPKIVFVTPFFYPVIGGVESHIFYKAQELIKLGYDIEVFTSDSNRSGIIENKSEVMDGIKVTRFKTKGKVGFGEVFFPEVFKAVKKSNADIFHVHGFRHNYNFVIWYTNKPLFITPHFPIYRGQRGKLVQLAVDLIDIFLGKYIFKKFNRICVVTGRETNWIKSFNVPDNKIILTPNAIPENYFKNYNSNNFRKKYKLKENEIVVLTVSRIHKSKGIDQLIRVAKHFPKVKFVIIGKDGGEQENLQNLTKQLNLKNIIFGGMVSEQEKLEAYSSADIFCSPSHFEGFCISILEAMAQKCAVITSDQGGMPWVVSDSGLIFKIGDLKDLKNKLNKLVENKDLRNNLIKKGSIRVKDFSWKKTAQILDREYKMLMKN